MELRETENSLAFFERKINQQRLEVDVPVES